MHYTLAKYWKKKVQDAQFHAGDWGGPRWSKYPGAQLEIKEIVWNFINTDNQQPTLREIKIHLEEHGYELSRSTISRLLQGWRWSFKIPTVTQGEKYTLSNMEYYVQFCR